MSQSGIIKLGDVIHIETGEQLNKSDMIPNGKYPVVNGGIDFSGNTDKYNNEANSITISQGGASAGYVNWIDRKFWAGAHCYVVTPLPHNDVRFLYHYIKFHEYNFMKSQQGAGIPSLNRSEIYKIPFPNLSNEKQKAIAEVLDTFTSLIANLETELASRQKQYEHYRNELLTFGANDVSIEWKTLGDIGEVRMCKRILKSQTNSEAGIPFYKIGTFGKKADAYISKEVYDEYRTKYNYPKKGDILISAAGTIGRTVEFDGTPSYFQDSNIVWIEHEEKLVTNKFLKIFYSIAEWKIQNGGSVSRLYNENLKATAIPIPTLQHQQEIVSTLDTFESLIQNIKQELDARKKQYEYYREKLLTFE